MVDRHDTALRTLAVGEGAQGGLPLKLAVTAGPDEGREVALGAAVEIGTDPSCGLVLAVTCSSPPPPAVRWPRISAAVTARCSPARASARWSSRSGPCSSSATPRS